MSFLSRIFCSILIVSFLFAAGCGDKQLFSEDFLNFKKDEGEVNQTSLEVEKSNLLKRLEKKYSDADSHYELGRIYQKESSWAQAEREFSIALNFDPVLRDAQAGRVKVLIDLGDDTKSDFLTEEYIGRAGNSALASLELGLAFQQHTLDDQALECYRQALRLAPNSAKINRQIGFYYLAKADDVRAYDYLSRSFQLNPNQPDVANQLGRLGVAVRVPKKRAGDTKRIDKKVEEYDKKLVD